MSDLLEIFSFGSLELRYCGEPITNVGSRRVEALLIYLACTRRAQAREGLADMLWDDRPQRRAMSNLRTVLTGLRQNFGPYVSITREEAFHVLRQAEAAGLVHSTANYRHQHFCICNCCTCCCGIMRSMAEFGLPTAIARSDFQATVDSEVCSGCGDCLVRCQFKALSIPADVCVVDHTHCVGCGLCATACPTEALHLERRTEGGVSQPPVDIKAWLVQRAEERNISIFDIL